LACGTRRREDVKKMMGALAAVVVLAVLRRLGPSLRDRAIAMCQEMFERSFGEGALDRSGRTSF